MESEPPNTPPAILSYASGGTDLELLERRFKKSVRVGLILILCDIGAMILAGLALELIAGRLLLIWLPGPVLLIIVSLECLGLWFVSVAPPPDGVDKSRNSRFWLRLFSAATALGAALVYAGIQIHLNPILICGAILCYGWLPLPWVLLAVMDHLARRAGRRALALSCMAISLSIFLVPLLALFLADISLFDWAYLPAILLNIAAGLVTWYIVLLIVLLKVYGKRI